MNTNVPVILLVDDSENDVFLMQIAFERSGFEGITRVAGGGEEAIAYLRGDDVYCDRLLFPSPALVLLDLNMAGLNGFEVLAWIRKQASLTHLPVHVLSASSRPEDKVRALELGANAYLVKPISLDRLQRMAEELIAHLQFNAGASPTGSIGSTQYSRGVKVDSDRS